MSEFKLKGASGKTYTIHTRNINWEFDPGEDAMDEAKDVVLIVCKIDSNSVTPVDVVYHRGPIKRYFKTRAQPYHIVSQTGAEDYATIWRDDEWEMEEIEKDLRLGYGLAV